MNITIDKERLGAPAASREVAPPFGPPPRGTPPVMAASPRSRGVLAESTGLTGRKVLVGYFGGGLNPNFPKRLLHTKYPALLYFAFFWNVPGSCCSDLTHLNLSLIVHHGMGTPGTRPTDGVRQHRASRQDLHEFSKSYLAARSP